jgi:hypothetical protein
MNMDDIIFLAAACSHHSFLFSHAQAQFKMKRGREIQGRSYNLCHLCSMPILLDLQLLDHKPVIID